MSQSLPAGHKGSMLELLYEDVKVYLKGLEARLISEILPFITTDEAVGEDCLAERSQKVRAMLPRLLIGALSMDVSASGSEIICDEKPIVLAGDRSLHTADACASTPAVTTDAEVSNTASPEEPKSEFAVAVGARTSDNESTQEVSEAEVEDLIEAFGALRAAPDGVDELGDMFASLSLRHSPQRASSSPSRAPNPLKSRDTKSCKEVRAVYTATTTPHPDPQCTPDSVSQKDHFHQECAILLPRSGTLDVACEVPLAEKVEDELSIESAEDSPTTNDSAIAPSDSPATELDVAVQASEKLTQDSAEIHTMSDHCAIEGIEAIPTKTGDELITSSADTIDDAHVALDMSETPYTHIVTSTPSSSAPEIATNDTIAPPTTFTVQEQPSIIEQPTTVTDSIACDEDSTMEEVAASGEAVTQSPDEIEHLVSKQDVVKITNIAPDHTTELSDVSSSIDAQKDVMEVDLIEKTIQNNAMEVQNTKTFTSLSAILTGVRCGESVNTSSLPEAMDVVLSTSATVKINQDDDMVDAVEAPVLQNTDAMHVNMTTSQDPAANEPRPSTFGRTSSDTMPSTPSPGDNASVTEPPNGGPMAPTAYSRVAETLLREFPNRHNDLEDALEYIVEQRDRTGARNVCEEVCEGIRLSTSAQQLAEDIQYEMQKDTSSRLLTEVQLTYLKTYATESRYNMLPHQQRDSSMSEAAAESKAAPLNDVKTTLPPPSQPKASISIKSPNTDMVDATNDVASSPPTTNEQIVSAPPQMTPSQVDAGVKEEHLAEETRDHEMKEDSAEDKMLALMTIAMKKVESNMFYRELFEIDLTSTTNRECILSFLLRRKWGDARVPKEKRAGVALEHFRAAIDDPLPTTRELIIFQCQVRLAKNRIECKNTRNPLRNVKERKEITGRLVDEFARQNYNLMQTMKVDKAMSWDKIVEKIDGMDKHAFACSRNGMNEIFSVYKSWMEKFSDKWTKPNAVLNYLLEQNPDSRPSAITPANRPSKHKVSAEHDTLAEDREAKKANKRGAE
ncbi:hypothetical protein NX059_002042 [Plenodomus lindquistii]|nr:hypothetical protein NX059_002042 [Plenodomus lindquistii]